MIVDNLTMLADARRPAGVDARRRRRAGRRYGPGRRAERATRRLPSAGVTAELSGVELRGLLGYEGHCADEADPMRA